MVFSDIPLPEIYKESADFRFFLRWIELCLSDIQYKTDNLIDLLDPQKCPSNLLWMLGDTCGYKYDERASVAFNRLVIMYFAKLIRYRGSKTGITLAAELNLDQFSLNEYAKEEPILEERLEDLSIPVNSVSVMSDLEKGYIDIVYYAEQVPTDICIEYVRPIGMYCFTHAGVSFNARTKVSVDARLTNINDNNLATNFASFGPSYVGHYSRFDYASMQGRVGTYYRSEYETQDEYEAGKVNLTNRNKVWYRNSKYEVETQDLSSINPGYRSLASLQLCNNEHIVKALLPSLEEPHKIFSLGYDPQDKLDIEVVHSTSFLKDKRSSNYNLRVDRYYEESLTPAVWTVDTAKRPTAPKPAVNPPMAAIGDAISLNANNTSHTNYDDNTGKINVVSISGESTD